MIYLNNDISKSNVLFTALGWTDRKSSSPTTLDPSAQRSIFRRFGGSELLHWFCPYQVRSCFGCSQALKFEGKIAQPPYDMVIITQMHTHFRAPNGELMSRKGNVYFHVQLNCVKIKQPYFVPEMTKISPMLMPHLTPIHFQFLRAFGMHLSDFRT